MTRLVLSWGVLAVFGVACGREGSAQPPVDGGSSMDSGGTVVAAPDLRFKWVGAGLKVQLDVLPVNQPLGVATTSGRGGVFSSRKHETDARFRSVGGFSHGAPEGCVHQPFLTKDQETFHENQECIVCPRRLFCAHGRFASREGQHAGRNHLRERTNRRGL